MNCDAIPAPKGLFACYTNRDWFRRPNHDSKSVGTQWIDKAFAWKSNCTHPILFGFLSQFDNITVPVDRVTATVHHSFVITFIDAIVSKTEIFFLRMRIFIFDLVRILRKWSHWFSRNRFLSPENKLKYCYSPNFNIRYPREQVSI